MTARRVFAALRPGLGVAGLGTLLTVAAAVFDAEPLYVPGLVLLGLFAVSVIWVGVGLLGAGVDRELGARRVEEGAPLDATLIVQRRFTALPGTRIVDPLLDGPLVLAARVGERRIRVQARFARRGARELAAPRLEIVDPIGLLTVRCAATGTPGSVLVLPRVEPVVTVGIEGAGRGRFGRRANTAVGAAETEVDGLRPLRPGTPASRIHWSAFARGAGLMERRLLPDTDARPLIVLDPRAPASTDALDAAVRASASLAVSLARAGGCALLLPGDRRPTDLDSALHGWAALHVRLALLDEADAAPLAIPPARRGPLLLVLARVPDRTPRALAGSQAQERTLVVPSSLSPLPGRRATFTVGGCTGFGLTRARPATRPPALAS